MYNVQTFREIGNASTKPVPSYCGVSHEINEQTIFWIEGILLSVVGLIGVLGNMVTFYVLSNIKSKRNIFNKLLIQLVSGDSISIILLFVDYSLRKSFQLFTIEDATYGSLWPTFIYPFIKISYTWIMCCNNLYGFYRIRGNYRFYKYL